MAERNDSKSQGRTVRLAIRSTASVSQAWLAWADPRKLAQWFVDEAEIKGEIYLWRWSAFGMAVPYRILESTPQSRLALGAELPGGGVTVLEIEVAADGKGSRIEISQSGLPPAPGKDADPDGIGSGWRIALAILRHYLEHHFGRERNSFFVMRPAAFASSDLRPYFRRQGDLARWLTQRGAIGDEGSTVDLVLKNGEPLTGEVLADTGLELAVSWAEIEGVLELKAFPMGNGQALALRGYGWGLSPERAAEIEEALSLALDRLAARFRP